MDLLHHATTRMKVVLIWTRSYYNFLLCQRPIKCTSVLCKRPGGKTSTFFSAAQLGLARFWLGSARPANHAARLRSARFRLGSASQPLGSARLGLGLGLGSALGGSGRLSSSSGGLGPAWLGSARSAQLGSARLGSEMCALRSKTNIFANATGKRSSITARARLDSARFRHSQPASQPSRLGSAQFRLGSASQPARLSLGLALGSGLAQLGDGLARLGLRAQLGSAQLSKVLSFPNYGNPLFNRTLTYIYGPRKN